AELARTKLGGDPREQIRVAAHPLDPDGREGDERDRGRGRDEADRPPALEDRDEGEEGQELRTERGEAEERSRPERRSTQRRRDGEQHERSRLPFGERDQRRGRKDREGE